MEIEVLDEKFLDERLSEGVITPPQTTPKGKFAAYQLTLWTDEQLEYFKNLDYRYLCYAPEIAPTTGKKHYQGYVAFHSQRSKAKLWKECPNCRIKEAYGTAKQNRIYTFGPYLNKKTGKMKDYNPEAVEFGDLPQPGKRNDIVGAATTITKERKRLRDCLQNEELIPITAKYPIFIRNLIEMNESDEAFKDYKNGWVPKVTVYWSRKSGVGKTRKAYDDNDIGVCVCNYGKEKDNIWFPNYEPEKIILFDEFTGDKISFEKFKMLTDRYPIDLPFKGGFRTRVKSNVIITSNLHPRDWWGGLPNDEFEQLARRMEIIEIV